MEAYKRVNFSKTYNLGDLPSKIRVMKYNNQAGYNYFILFYYKFFDNTMCIHSIRLKNFARNCH